MSIIWTGPGDVGLRTTGIAGGAANQLVFPYGLYSGTLAQEVSTENAEVYRGGVRVPDTVLKSSVTTTLTLSTQLNNWDTLGLSLNQFQRTESTITIPVVRRATVPTASPYEINDALIVSGNLTTVVASVEEPGAWGVPGALTKVSIAPANDREYQATAGKLIFDESMAGADITYVLTRSVATAKTYGGAGNVTAIGDLEFTGEVYNSAGAIDAYIQLPSIAVSSTPSFEFSGGVLEVEITFNVNTPAGWAAPYRYINYASIT